MKNNYKDFPQSLKVSNMSPLDAKSMVNSLNELTDLGQDDNKAYTYYRGMTIYCHEDKKKYEWTDNLKERTKLLDSDFVYPRGTEFDGVDYSGLSFNFVEYKTAQEDLLIENLVIKRKIIQFNKLYLDANNNTVNHKLNIDVIADIKFIFPKKLYNQSCPVIFSPIELMIFGIISSFEIVDNNSFKLNNWSNYQNLSEEDMIHVIIEYSESDGLRN